MEMRTTLPKPYSRLQTTGYNINAPPHSSSNAGSVSPHTVAACAPKIDPPFCSHRTTPSTWALLNNKSGSNLVVFFVVIVAEVFHTNTYTMRLILTPSIQKHFGRCLNKHARDECLLVRIIHIRWNRLACLPDSTGALGNGIYPVEGVGWSWHDSNPQPLQCDFYRGVVHKVHGLDMVA